MNQPPTAAIVERVETEHLYEILVDGKRAGLTAYRDRGAQRVFFHTEVDATFDGQGLATQLVKQALTDVRAAGKRIVPVCRHMATLLKRHTEFVDITEPGHPRSPAMVGNRTALIRGNGYYPCRH